MKKIILALITLFLTACYTPTVDQTELYGTVETILYYNGHNHVKAWCKEKQKYYEIITDKLYQHGEVIKIK